MKSLIAIAASLFMATVTLAGNGHGSHHGYRGRWCDSAFDSTYMDGDQAVEFAKQLLAERQKSLGEVAREYRARKAQQAALEKAQSNATNPAAPAAASSAAPQSSTK